MERHEDGTVKIDHSCWKCGKQHDAAITVDGDRGPAPRDNDVAFCLSCGAFGIFQDGQNRQPTVAEEDDLMRDPDCRQTILRWTNMEREKRGEPPIESGPLGLTVALVGRRAFDELLREAVAAVNQMIMDECVKACADILGRHGYIGGCVIVMTDKEGNPAEIAHAPVAMDHVEMLRKAYQIMRKRRAQARSVG